MSVFETLKATLSSVFALKYKTDTQIFVQKQIWLVGKVLGQCFYQH